MDGLNDLSVGFLWERIIDKEGSYGAVKTGLKCVFYVAWTGGGSGDRKGRMCGDKFSGKKLGGEK